MRIAGALRDALRALLRDAAADGRDRGLSYEQAMANNRALGDAALWPAATPGNRLQPAQPRLQPGFRFEPGATIFTIGSCFARNIEEHLQPRGFRLPTLDFKVPEAEWPVGRRNGILNKYTPPSILQELQWAQRIMARGGPPEDPDTDLMLLPLPDGSVVDLELGGFLPVSHLRARARRREVYECFRHAFSADVVTITLGLVEAWFDTATGRYIQQTPRPEMVAAHPGRFRLRVLDFAECERCVTGAVELLLGHGRPGKKILLTTSPVPMGRTFTAQDVLIANTASKSLLRVVAGLAAERFADVDYYPSYESVVLTRDDAIWGRDQRHVTDACVGRIVGALIQAYGSAATPADTAAAATPDTVTPAPPAVSPAAAEPPAAATDAAQRAPVLIERADALAATGDLAGATALLASALRDGKPVGVARRLAELHVEAGERAAAVAVLEQALRAVPGHRRLQADLDALRGAGTPSATPPATPAAGRRRGS